MTDNGDIKADRETPKRKEMHLCGSGPVQREYVINKACGPYGRVVDLSVEVLKDLGGLPAIRVDFDESQHPDRGHHVYVLLTGVELAFEWRIVDAPAEPAILPGTEDELARARMVARAAQAAKGKLQ